MFYKSKTKYTAYGGARGGGKTHVMRIKAVMGARRPGDPARLVAGVGRARTELGWSPRFTQIDQIVESAWKWHKAHPNGYAPAN